MAFNFTKKQIIIAATTLATTIAAGVGGFFLHKRHKEKKALETIPVEKSEERVQRRREAREEAHKNKSDKEKEKPASERYRWGGPKEAVEARFAEAEAPREEDDSEPETEAEADFTVPEVEEPEEYDLKEEDIPAQKRIHIIEKDEFDNDDEYEKVYLTFYEGDGVISDERDEIVENWRELVGKEAPSELEIYDTIAEMYVRNEKRHTDFALIKALGDYPFKEDVNE